ncbi:hypothetical protein K3495_g12106 [Podosphaera aphanis]|nr:hypothetical protein K3495_g12106 [Podosphaera aphanis]
MEQLVGNFTIRTPVSKTPRYTKQLISEEITKNVMNLNAQFTQEDTEGLIPLSPPPNRTYATCQAAQDALLKWSRLRDMLTAFVQKSPSIKIRRINTQYASTRAATWSLYIILQLQYAGHLLGESAAFTVLR